MNKKHVITKVVILILLIAKIVYYPGTVTNNISLNNQSLNVSKTKNQNAALSTTSILFDQKSAGEPSLEDDNPIIIQHRSNNKRRIEEALRNNFDGIEFDVHITSDDQLILQHDPEVVVDDVRSTQRIVDKFLIRKKEFESYFDSYESVEKAIKKGSFDTFLPERQLTREHLKELGLTDVQLEEIWSQLIDKKYINKHGKLLKKFKQIANDLTDSEEEARKQGKTRWQDIDAAKREKLQKIFDINAIPQIKLQLYNIVNRVRKFSDLWNILESHYQIISVAKETTAEHILLTVRIVDKIVDKLAENNEIEISSVKRIKRKARMLMLFHDIGKAFCCDEFYPVANHAVLSSRAVTEVFSRLGYSKESQKIDSYLIAHHGTLGLLPWSECGDRTDVGEHVIDFVKNLKNPFYVTMLKIIWLCDISNRSGEWFLTCKWNLGKADSICSMAKDILNAPSCLEKQSKLLVYLKNYKTIIGLSWKTARGFETKIKQIDWRIKMVFTKMVMDLLEIEKKDQELNEFNLKKIEEILITK
ncbi:glycerophosphodiester phosphodiesterase family protein [bacterium]